MYEEAMKESEMGTKTSQLRNGHDQLSKLSSCMDVAKRWATWLSLEYPLVK